MLDVQGNTSYGNSQLLLQTKLVSILERLVEKTALEGAQDGADEVTKLTKPTTSDETGLEGAQDDAAFSRLVASMDAKASTPPARDAAHLHANLDPEMEQLVARMTTPSGMTTPAEAADEPATAGRSSLDDLFAL
jgi:hypothetical protein